MKFKSNPVCCLVMENVSFFNPHLHKNMFREIQTHFENPKLFFKKMVGLPFNNFEKIQIFRYLDIKKISFKDDSMIFLVFSEVFW